MVAKRNLTTNCREQCGDGCMNSKIVRICIRIVMVGRPYVIVDGPNIYHDNICLDCEPGIRHCPECKKGQETCHKHGTRLCEECQKQMIKDKLIKWTKEGLVANTNHDNWDRTLDIKRLLVVEQEIARKGYKPLIYVYESTIEYMELRKEKYPEIPQKLEILHGLDTRRRLVPFEPYKPPGVDKSDDPNWDDDLWIIETAIELEKKERIDCYIMSNDNFSNYSKEGGKDFIKFDWSWEKIRERKVDHKWIPKIGEEFEDQVLVSPKWVKVPKFELTIEEERKLTDARIEATEIELDNLKKHKAHLSSQTEEQEDLPEMLLKTEGKVLSKPLQKYKKEVTTAVWWVCEYKMDENGFITTADIWDSIARKIKEVKANSLISDLLGSGLGNSVQYDEDEFLKVELGYNKNTDVIKIVEDAILIYQVRQGVELKFTPDQLKLRVMK